MRASGDRGPSGATSPFEPGAVVDLEITSLAYSARGVARHEGLVVFVEGALPGETVRARVRRIRSGYAEAVTKEVLRAAGDRTAPRCEHYAVCGGCDLQHMDPQAQARAKGGQVREILQRVAHIENPPVIDSRDTGEPWGYRFRIDLDWDEEPPGRPVLGLHRRDRPLDVFSLHHCHLVGEEVNRIALWVASRVRDLRLQAWVRRRRRGFLRRLSVQSARNTGEILVTLETGRGEPAAIPALAQELRRRFPRVVGVVRREHDRGGKFLETSVLDGRDHLHEEVGGDRFRVPASAFFQPNVFGAALLRQEAVAALQLNGSENVLELFCGVGLFTLELARRAAGVTAVEGSRETLAAARENARRAELGNIRFIEGDVERALRDLTASSGWDAVLVDPPRTGLGREVTRLLAASETPRLVYVSCDPGTMARDLGILCGEGGFEVQEVRPLDLFPQTQHIESVVRLVRGGVNGRRPVSGEPREHG